jgi:hypothetical protein
LILCGFFDFLVYRCVLCISQAPLKTSVGCTDFCILHCCVVEFPVYSSTYTLSSYDSLFFFSYVACVHLLAVICMCMCTPFENIASTMAAFFPFFHSFNSQIRESQSIICYFTFEEDSKKFNVKRSVLYDDLRVI